ncbi:MAG: deoxynucleoside kinase [Bacteroidota bacterium]
MSFPYRHIAIEGNIGTGKTTLAKMLAADFQAELLLEQFSDNPFLQSFYQQPERYALPVELFFMAERHQQLHQRSTQKAVNTPLLISDYCFEKTLLFAKNNLSEAEFDLFYRLFQALNTTSTQPDILIFLQRPVQVLLQQIRQRGRVFEANIDAHYLNALESAYFNFLESIADIPVLVLSLSDKAFWNCASDYQKILYYMRQTYTVGIHHISVF